MTWIILAAFLLFEKLAEEENIDNLQYIFREKCKVRNWEAFFHLHHNYNFHELDGYAAETHE